MNETEQPKMIDSIELAEVVLAAAGKSGAAALLNERNQQIGVARKTIKTQEVEIERLTGRLTEMRTERDDYVNKFNQVHTDWVAADDRVEQLENHMTEIGADIPKSNYIRGTGAPTPERLKALSDDEA